MDGLLSLLTTEAAYDSQSAIEGLSQVCAWALSDRRADVVHAGALSAMLTCMQSHPWLERVQAIGCEALGLLAGGPDGLEQQIFDAGAVEACLAACQRFPRSEDVLAASYQAISNVCFGASDLKGCARKQAAVELGALEAIARGMTAMQQKKWVQEAAVMAVGCLTNGVDEKVVRRRQKASSVGVLQLAKRAMERFPVEDATPTHAHAYAAACASLQSLEAVVLG